MFTLNICPDCGDVLQEKIINKKRTVRCKEVSFDVTLLECKYCGFIYDRESLIDLAFRKYREDKKWMQTEDITLLRCSFDLGFGEISKISNIKKERFINLECGLELQTDEEENILRKLQKELFDIRDAVMRFKGILIHLKNNENGKVYSLGKEVFYEYIDRFTNYPNKLIVLEYLLSDFSIKEFSDYVIKKQNKTKKGSKNE